MGARSGRDQSWETYPFGLLLVLSMFAFFTPGPALPSGPDVSDKLEHALIFAALALSGRFAGYAARPLLVGLLAYAVLSEVVQAVLPIHRRGDWQDALADGAGVVAGLLVVHLGSLALARLERSRSTRR